ncbi:phosphatase domain-containing protein [Pseudomonas sp. RT6P73]
MKVRHLTGMRPLGNVAIWVMLTLMSTDARAVVTELPLLSPEHAMIWAAPVDTTFNLYQMTPTLYRSALPNTENLPLLQQLQVKTVVSFIKVNDASWLGDALVKRVSIPLHADRVDDADVLRVLRTLQEAETNGPVLMHCKHGRNRTGLMAAMYRTVVQGWSKEEALKEMQQGGYGDPGQLEDAMHYVKNADITQLRLAFVKGDCSTSQLSTCHVRNWLKSY